MTRINKIKEEIIKGLARDIFRQAAFSYLPISEEESILQASNLVNSLVEAVIEKNNKEALAKENAIPVIKEKS